MTTLPRGIAPDVASADEAKDDHPGRLPGLGSVDVVLDHDALRRLHLHPLRRQQKQIGRRFAATTMVALKISGRTAAAAP